MKSLTSGAEFANTPLDAVYRYIELGWYVLPCCPPDDSGSCGCGRGHKGRDIGKAPLTEHGHKDAFQDIGLVKSWWGVEPELNIGISLEPSGLVLVDADGPEGVREVEQRGIPEGTAISVTSRGRHYLFRRTVEPITYRKNVGCSRQLEVKTNGYFVAPPSRHLSGHVYHWLVPPSKDLPPAPPWVQELLEKAEQEAPKRDTTANVESLLVRAVWHFLPPRAKAILEGKIATDDRSGLAYELACLLAEAGIRDPEAIAEVVKQAPCHIDKYGGRVGGWDSDADAQAIAEKALQSHNHMLPVVDAAEVEEQPVNWLVNGLLVRGGILLLAGRPKTGKTSILLHLLASIMQGREFAGKSTTQASILYLGTETEPDEVKRVVFGVYGTPISAEGPKLYCLDLRRLSPVQGLRAFRWPTIFETAGELGCGVVVIDPIATVTRNRAKDTTSSYEQIYEQLMHAIHWSRQTGIAVVAITHSAKGKHVVKDIADVIDAPINTTAYSAAVDVIAAWGKSPQYQDDRHRRLLATGRRDAGVDAIFAWDGKRYNFIPTSERPLSALAREMFEIMQSRPTRTWTTRQMREVTNRSHADVMSGFRELYEHGLVVFERVGNRIEWSLPIQVEIDHSRVC